MTIRYNGPGQQDANCNPLPIGAFTVGTEPNESLLGYNQCEFIHREGVATLAGMNFDNTLPIQQQLQHSGTLVALEKLKRCQRKLASHLNYRCHAYPIARLVYCKLRALREEGKKIVCESYKTKKNQVKSNRISTRDRYEILVQTCDDPQLFADFVNCRPETHHGGETNEPSSSESQKTPGH